MTEKELPEQAAEDGEASNIPTLTSATSDSAEREIKNLKALLAQQSRQISSLTQTVSELVAEVKSLKSS